MLGFGNCTCGMWDIRISSVDNVKLKMRLKMRHNSPTALSHRTRSKKSVKTWK